MGQLVNVIESLYNKCTNAVMPNSNTFKKVSNNCQISPKSHIVSVPFQHILGANQTNALEGFIGTIAVGWRNQLLSFADDIFV